MSFVFTAVIFNLVVLFCWGRGWVSNSVLGICYGPSLQENLHMQKTRHFRIFMAFLNFNFELRLRISILNISTCLFSLHCMYISFWPALPGLFFTELFLLFCYFSFFPFLFLSVSLQAYGFLFIPYMISCSDCNSQIVLMIFKVLWRFPLTPAFTCFVLIIDCIWS